MCVYLRAMAGTVWCWPCINSTYVCIVVCLLPKLLLVFSAVIHCDAVMSPSFTVKTYHDARRAFIFLLWMERCRVSCTNSRYVYIAVCLLSKLLFVCNAVWGCNLTFICCQHIVILGLHPMVGLRLDCMMVGRTKSEESSRKIDTRVRCLST